MGIPGQLIAWNGGFGPQTEAGCRVNFVSQRYLSQPRPFFLSSQTANFNTTCVSRGMHELFL